MNIDQFFCIYVLKLFLTRFVINLQWHFCPQENNIFLVVLQWLGTLSLQILYRLNPFFKECLSHYRFWSFLIVIVKLPG